MYYYRTGIDHFEDSNPQYRIYMWNCLCKLSTNLKWCKKYTESFGDNNLIHKLNIGFDQCKVSILSWNCCTSNSFSKWNLNFENSLFDSSHRPNLYKFGTQKIENYIKHKFHCFKESNQFYKEGSCLSHCN